MNKFFTIAISLIFIVSSCKSLPKTPSYFLPQGYVIYEKIFGDLNNDGQKDCILIIKGTDKNYSEVVNQFGKKVDRNRRGIIILLNKQGKYQRTTKNYNCFYSENEDGGNYYAPQLAFQVAKGNLIIHYEHGRYGLWSYTFRLINTEFKLIKYEATSLFGPRVNSETYINFLTKEKLIRENINDDDDGNDEIFKDTKSVIIIDTLLSLSEIEDFEKLDVSIY